MNEEYELECPLCDTLVELVVIDEESLPAFCPMCGTDVVWDSLESID